MKTKIVMRSVANRFKPTAKVAKTVNGVDSGMKHINVLKRNISAKWRSIFFIYKAREIDSPTSINPQIPATIIYVGIRWSIGHVPR